MSMSVRELALLGVLGMNVLSFGLMGADKRRARKGRRRIRERTLWIVSALSGALGGLLGMAVFHHKTRHWRFRVGMPALLAVQAVLLGALML